MSGHSKFANIKHKKEKNDAAKGKIFTIIGREIAVAVKEGGPDPANNSRLRDVIAKAPSFSFHFSPVSFHFCHVLLCFICFCYTIIHFVCQVCYWYLRGIPFHFHKNVIFYQIKNSPI